MNDNSSTNNIEPDQGLVPLHYHVSTDDHIYEANEIHDNNHNHALENHPLTYHSLHQHHHQHFKTDESYNHGNAINDSNNNQDKHKEHPLIYDLLKEILRLHTQSHHHSSKADASNENGFMTRQEPLIVPPLVGCSINFKQIQNVI